MPTPHKQRRCSMPARHPGLATATLAAGGGPLETAGASLGVTAGMALAAMKVKTPSAAAGWKTPPLCNSPPLVTSAGAAGLATASSSAREETTAARVPASADSADEKAPPEGGTTNEAPPEGETTNERRRRRNYERALA